jgi:radical SAM superfamily enzyme YgiQ (UPF0313 family)
LDFYFLGRALKALAESFLMRVLLISLNIEKLPDPVVPLGLAFLSSAVKSAGHEVQCLDLCFEEDIEAAVEAAVTRFAPEAFGLSLRNIDNVAYPQTVSYLPFYKKVVACCRGNSQAPIFLGGSGFTVMPEPVLHYLEADGGIVGEGEEAFAGLLDAMAGGFALSRGGFLKRGQNGSFRPSCIRDLSSLPSPDWDCLDLARYFSRGGMGNLQTKRGCSFSCIYCTYPLIEGKTVRLRPAERVADEAEELIQRGVAHAFIVDNIFNFPEDHAREVCRALGKRELSLKWSCYVHPAFFSRALAEEMREAGCTGVEFGTDSGAPDVLKRLKKNFTPADIRRATGVARQAGLEVCHSLSLGAPGETEETLRETFDLMEEVSPTAVIAMVGLRIFPKTELAQVAKEERILSPGQDLLEPAFYVAPGVKDRILDLVLDEAAIHPNWILPGLNLHYSEKLGAKLRRLGVKGPLWEYMKVLRRRESVKRNPYA